MRSETTLRIAPDHPAFAGHFPGAPIVPGVVLLDAAVHAALKLLRPLAQAHSCQIGSAKFLSTVGPGEVLTMSLATSESGKVQFELTSGDRQVATGTLLVPAAP
jgi:3-hydroxyacyl-[acyl-carrier-protein] dehydratase